jgi:hypothetical protein
MAGSSALQLLPPTAPGPSTTDPELVATLRSALPDHLQRHLGSARRLARERTDAPAVSLLSATLVPFDRLLEGGLPRGSLVELIGRRSSGRFSTVLSTLAATTLSGEAAALVDLGDGLDPQAAAEAGATLDRLLWVRPRHLKQALISAETLLNGGFPLVILELGSPPVAGGRGAEASWLRLARAAASHRGALLVSSPYRVSGTAAAVVVKADRGRSVWSGHGRSPRLLAGLSARLSLEKLRGRHTSGTQTIHLATNPEEGLRGLGAQGLRAPHPTGSSVPLGPYAPTPLRPGGGRVVP